MLHLNVSTVDPGRVIHAAIDAVQLAADARGVEISVTLAPDAGQLVGDAQRLQQVIWNLLSNAIKFSPKGRRIDVSLLRLGDVIEIAVADAGRGISAEFLPHVFERFRQADASSSRSQGGVGLGLAIVKQLIELHGGSVEAASEGEGKGATFTVRLPVATTRREPGRESTTGPLASPRGVSAEFVPVSLLGLRVAVVEDEADTREMIEHLLRLCEAEVRTAASAAEGLELVRTWRPDLLISDIGMPNRDGFAFIRDVRALPREQGGAVPAIALTGYAGVEDRVRVLATGFQMHVAKPVEPEEFVAVVASVVGFERQQSVSYRDVHGPVN